MFFVDIKKESKPLTIRKTILANLDKEIERVIQSFCGLLNLSLVELNIGENEIMTADGIVTVYEVNYKLRDENGNIGKYKTFIPKFVGNYIILNGMRYVFVYSIADRYLTRFGAQKTDAKLSNLYRKVVFKNILSDNIVYYESKHKKLPLLNFLILYRWRDQDPGLSHPPDILQSLYELLAENNYHVTLEQLDTAQTTEQKKNKKRSEKPKIEVIHSENTITYVDVQTNQKLIVDVTYESNYRTRLAKSFKDYGGNHVLEKLLGKKTYEVCNLLYGEFVAIFDPFVREEYKSPQDFIKLLMSTDFVDYIKSIDSHAAIKSKIIRLKTFVMHPLVRQLMHLLYEKIRTGKIPLKHTTTLSILYKVMQIELAEDKLNNPISETMLLLKATFAHKFAIKRLSPHIRLITDIQGIVDPIVTPESKKVGSVNYVVFEFDKEIL